MGRDDRIFCVIVAGEPNAGDIAARQAEECFPPALRSHLAADGTPTGHRFEPIAADARSGGDGRVNVKLKILSGLLNVGFDVLKQREQRRRIQRMTLVTSLSLVTMLVTTGLAISARNARIAAEHRQREAETLVDFMLGDLNNKLRQVQRLDILEAVDNQAMAYFLARPSKELTRSSTRPARQSAAEDRQRARGPRQAPCCDGGLSCGRGGSSRINAARARAT